MKIMDVTVRDVAVCRPEQSLEQAAQIMWEQDCGAVPVVDGEHRPVGMVTDRDICMTAYLRGRPLRDVVVREVMAQEIRCCRDTDSLDVPHRTMREHQIRRLPVVDAEGVLVGVVSLADLALASERAGGGKPGPGDSAELIATLLAVSRPRSTGKDLLVPQPKTGHAKPAAGGRSGPSGIKQKNKRKKAR